MPAVPAAADWRSSRRWVKPPPARMLKHRFQDEFAVQTLGLSPTAAIRLNGPLRRTGFRPGGCQVPRVPGLAPAESRSDGHRRIQPRSGRFQAVRNHTCTYVWRGILQVVDKKIVCQHRRLLTGCIQIEHGEDQEQPPGSPPPGLSTRQDSRRS